MSKQILVFGAGKSATCLIDFLLQEATLNNWTVTVADNDLLLAQSKTAGHPNARAVAINVENTNERNELVKAAAVVISLLPPVLHLLVAQDCLLFNKNLLTASYTDEGMRGLQKEIQNKNLLFLCEMGLDPGIDHMSAMQLIHRIKNEGGTISSFMSHCGGLVAPESDDNPWHYKISWNPRNVVMAGKSGAVYREQHQIKKLAYEELFDETRLVDFPGTDQFSWYPNRDSIEYTSVYGLENAADFIRTTLRHPLFSAGWRKLIELKFTDQTLFYETDGMSLQTFFSRHFETIGYPVSRLNEKALEVFKTQLASLGADDNTTLINKGFCSAMDVLQFALEKKLALLEKDRDMIVMLHEIEYTLAEKKYKSTSQLMVKGEDNRRTAMAKTVGLPLGIAAKLILDGKIKETGLHIPVIPALYEPVLAALREQGIIFYERTELIQ